MRLIYSLIYALCLFVFSTTLTAAQREEPIVYLSLEGGGMHMVAALETIRRIEQAANRPISELVDGIIGLSSGAVIAAHLLVPNEEGKAKWSAENLKKEFSSTLVNGALGSALGGSISNFFGSKVKTFRTLFNENLGNISMKESLKRLIIISYNSQTKTQGVFDSRDERHHKIPIWNIAQASVSTVANKMGIEWSAGPTTIQFDTDSLSPGWIDGGYGLHEPIYELLANKLTQECPEREVVIYSFGSGSSSFKGSSKPDFAVATWKKNNISIVRFQPIYNDIDPTWLNIDNWYLMLLNPRPNNIDTIERHFFSEELLNSAEYAAMFTRLTGPTDRQAAGNIQ